MTGRPLPQSDRFELYALGRILTEWANSKLRVEKVFKGDQGIFTFDWLLRTSEGCIGLEVVRAEDPDQLDHIEAEVVAGAAVITGSAEMPWESVERQVGRKMERATESGGYRDQLNALKCDRTELHLAVTSWGQELSLTPDLIWPQLEQALDTFDAVWLVHGKVTEARRGT